MTHSFPKRRSSDLRVRELMENEEYVFQVMIEHMLTVRASVLEACAKLHKLVLNFVAGDEVCRRFMTVPGVGPITALSFKAAIDAPHRFRRSRNDRNSVVQGRSVSVR